MSVLTGLRGALLLARGRPEGVQLVDGDHAAAIRSFWAIPLCLPAIIGPRLLTWIASGGVPAGAPIALGRQVLLFLIGWLLFVWVSHFLARMIDKETQWPRFIVVWSFCNVLENTAIVLAAIPGLLGAPAMLDEAIQLVAIGWALWLEWYAIRLSLTVGPLTALVLLAVDTGISIIAALIGVLLS